LRGSGGRQLNPAIIALRGHADSFLAGAVDSASLVFLSLPTALGVLLAGMAVGSLGGLIAARNTREVAD